MMFTPKTPLYLPARANEYSPGSGFRLPYPTKKYQGTPVKKSKKETMAEVDATCPAERPAAASPYGSGGWGLGYDSDVDHADNEGTTTSFLARLQAAKDTRKSKKIKLENEAANVPVGDKAGTPPQETQTEEPLAVKLLSTPVRREVAVTKTETTVGEIGDCPRHPAATSYSSQTGMKRKGQFIHIYRCTVIPPTV